MRTLLWIAIPVMLAGGVGSVLRLLLSQWSSILPWGILAANTLASFAAALAMGAIGEYGEHAIWISGLCGGLSTFSTFAGQTVDFFRRGRIAQGLTNIVLNFGFITTAAFVGLWVAATLLK
ncbi:MAG: hypothetical protein RLZZ229_173 [Actinomycetota bacterium]|jgi:CrcB protein